jgi:hypothetical protein
VVVVLRRVLVLVCMHRPAQTAKTGGWMEHAARYTAQQPASEPLRAVGARRAICLGGGAEVPPAAVFDYYIQLALFVYSVHVVLPAIYE